MSSTPSVHAACCACSGPLLARDRKSRRRNNFGSYPGFKEHLSGACAAMPAPDPELTWLIVRALRCSNCQSARREII